MNPTFPSQAAQAIAHPRWRAVAAAAALGVALSAHAAPTAVAVSATGLYGTTPALDSGCTTVFSLSTTVTCDEGSLTASIYSSARADPRGRLRGLAEVAQTTEGVGVLATATASLTQARVFFTPLVADRTVLVRLTLDGTQAVSYDATTTDGTPKASAITFIRYNIRRDGSPDAAAFDELLVRRSLLDFGPFEQGFTATQRTVRGVDGAFSEVAGFPAAPLFRFDLAAGTSFFDFTFKFDTNAQMVAGAAGSVSTRYFNTASLDSFQFLDAAGNDVTALSGISFSEGEVYGLVPEPASALLGAFGLGMLALLRRRQRGYSD